MVGEVSGWDYAEACDIVRWPVTEVLNAYTAALKRAATEQYRNALLVWASLAPHAKSKTQPPKVPDILKD